jgi:hypothetical protein
LLVLEEREKDMEKNVETEVKLLFGKKELKELLELSMVVKKIRKGSHATLKLVNTYYDTKDLILRQAGIAYRIRQTGKNFEQTIKMSKKAAGGLTSRGEYTVPASGWHPDLSAFAGTGLPVDVEGLLGGARVEKLFSVRVKREIRLLQITPATLVEMAIDQGHVLAGKRKDTINEVELELKEGSVGDLLSYIGQLAQHVPFFTESRSKYVRGLVLLGKLDPGAGAWTPFGPDGKNSYAGAVKGQIYQYGTRVLEEQNAFREESIETEADRIFLPSFTAILQNLVWVHTLLDGAYGMEMNLEGVLAPLRKLQHLKEAKALWKKLYGVVGRETWGPDKLTPLFQKAVVETGRKIRAQVQSGAYTATIFTLYGAMEKGTWNAGDYLRYDQMLRLCADRLLDELHTRLGESGQSRSPKRQHTVTLLQQLAAITGQTKVDGIAKDSRKKLERLAAGVEGSENRVAVLQVLSTRFTKIKDVTEARQAGLFYGWLLSDLQARYRKDDKTIRKWASSIKFPNHSDKENK